MKWGFSFLLSVFFTLESAAQDKDSISYQQLLGITHEIQVGDSLLLTTGIPTGTPLDSTAIKKWCRIIYHTPDSQYTHTIRYSLIGKMTGSPDFDLLLIEEERTRVDSTHSQHLYLASLEKTGRFISIAEAASTGEIRKIKRTITSWLHKDGTLVGHYSIFTNMHSFTGSTQQRINAQGRFIMLLNDQATAK